MSAILLLDGVMILISYRSPTISISLSLSIWHNSQCKRRLVAIFVTMATGVGLRQISLIPLNSQTPTTPKLVQVQMTPLDSPPSKTPYLVQESGTYLPQKPSYSQFSVKIFKLSFPWQQECWSETNFASTDKFPENSLVGAIIGDVSYIEAELYEMLCLMTTIGYHGNRSWFGVSLNDNIKLADPENPLIGARIRNISPI